MTLLAVNNGCSQIAAHIIARSALIAPGPHRRRARPYRAPPQPAASQRRIVAALGGLEIVRWHTVEAL